MRKYILCYVIVLLIFGVGILLTLKVGTRFYSRPLEPQQAAQQSLQNSTPPPVKSEAHSMSTITEVVRENLGHPLSVLLIQIITILVATRIIGLLFRKAGQPMVVGEMIAGILLGPSLLGMLSPGTMTFLFPPQSMDALKLLSQIGVIIFMFIVGMELNTRNLRRNVHTAVLVSHASIIIPLFLGAAFSLLIYRPYASEHTTFLAFTLFMSVSISITAFPVLARVIEERGLSGSEVGTTVIACAAVDDVTAWCLLAVVIAIVKAGGVEGAALTIIFTMLLITFMLFVLKPRAERIIGKEIELRATNGALTAIILTFTFASALLTELIGIHALFGAFLAGVVMPSNLRLRQFLKERLETFTVALLLPLYFTFTGLRTQVGLLNDWSSWVVFAGIVFIAIAGKLGGSALAARWSGMSWRDSLTIGVLMNTRGLIELIVLNIGYDLGILNPQVYSMMVLMALITTFMTGPLLYLIESLRLRARVVISGTDAVA